MGEILNRLNFQLLTTVLMVAVSAVGMLASPVCVNVHAADDTNAKADSSGQLSTEQQRIAEKYKHLEEVLLRMAELTATTDPQRAELLRKTVAQSKQRLIGVQFEKLVELLDRQRLSRAIEGQRDVERDLIQLLELLLSEDRAKRIAAEKTRIRKYLKHLNRIIRKQKALEGRTEGKGDAKKLAQEQGQLGDQTGRLSGQMKSDEELGKPGGGEKSSEKSGEKDDDKSGDKKDGGDKGKKSGDAKDRKEGSKAGGKSEQKSAQESGQQGGHKGDQQGGKDSQGKPSDKSSPGQSGGKSGEQNGKQSEESSGNQSEQQSQQPQSQADNPARKRLEAARQKMKEAQEALEKAKHEGAVEKQEEALRQLEQAKAELEKILRQLREEEMKRMLTALGARFAKMLKLEREVYKGTVLLDKVPKAQRGHEHEIGTGRLAGKQSKITVEADKVLLLLKEDGTAVAFPEAVSQMREDMQQAAARLGQNRVGKITQGLEEDILAALEEMIEALKKELEKLEEQKSQQSQQGGEKQDPALIETLAELKMIRALQMRVNRRTDRYGKLIDGEEARNHELQEALRRLAQREARIYEVTRKLDLEKGK